MPGLFVSAISILPVLFLLIIPGIQELYFREFRAITLLAVFSLVWIHFRKPDSLKAKNIYRLFLFAFLALCSLVITVESLSFIVDTEIPRLKYIFRFVYYLTTISIPVFYYLESPPLTPALLLLAVFSSLPFSWVVTLQPFSMFPLLLVFLAILLDGSTMDLAKTWNDKRKSILSGRALYLFFPILPAVALFLSDRTSSGPGTVIFWLIAWIVPLFRNRISVRQIRWVLLSAIAINLGVLVVSSLALLHRFGASYLLFAKKSTLAGISSNDAGGILVLSAGILAVFLLDKTDNEKERKKNGFETVFARVGEKTLAGLFLPITLFLIWIVHSRLSFVSVAFLSSAILAILPETTKHSPEPRMVGKRIWILLFFWVVVSGIAIFLYTGISELPVPESILSRMGLFHNGFHLLLKYPLLGAGPERFSALTTIPLHRDSPPARILSHQFLQEGTHLHSHNTFLQLSLEAGLPAALWIFSAIFFLILRPFSLEEKQSMGNKGIRELSVSIMFLVVLFHGITNYHFMSGSYVALLGMLALYGLSGNGDSWLRNQMDREVSVPEGKGLPLAGGFLFAVFILGFLLGIDYWKRQAETVPGLPLHYDANGNHLFYSPGIRSLDTDPEPVPENTLLESLDRIDSIGRILFWNSEIQQFLGELNLRLFAVSKDRKNIDRARNHYRLCANYSRTPALCQDRLCLISTIQGKGNGCPEKFPGDPYSLLDYGRIGKH